MERVESGVHYVYRVWAEGTKYTENIPWPIEQLAEVFFVGNAAEKFVKHLIAEGRKEDTWTFKTPIHVKDWNGDVQIFIVETEMKVVYNARRIDE